MEFVSLEDIDEMSIAELRDYYEKHGDLIPAVLSAYIGCLLSADKYREEGDEERAKRPERIAMRHRWDIEAGVLEKDSRTSDEIWEDMRRSAD